MHALIRVRNFSIDRWQALLTEPALEELREEGFSGKSPWYIHPPPPRDWLAVIEAGMAG